MDDFSMKLSKVEGEMKEPLIERDEGERVENMGVCSDIDREIMFENAPNKNNTSKGTSDFIVGEKKSW